MAQTHRLNIRGTIDVSQFWPDGKSDADTTKVIVSVQPGDIRVRKAGQSQFKPTQAYKDAVIVQGTKKDGDRDVKPVIKNGQITVRLQRIDAPELHYRPDPRGSGGKLKGTGLVTDYRQHQAETATRRVGQFLKTFGSTKVDCTFTSELNPKEGPSAAIDRYGRFVGDIILPDGINLNLWLLEQGLSVIALYDSMLPHEIDESIAAWQAGQKLADGITRLYSARFLKFDPSLKLRSGTASGPIEGKQRFMHPKFYRRQTTWWAFNQADIFEGDFLDWLESKDEQCWYLPEFRDKGARATKYPLYDRQFDGDGISWGPEDFIFAESASSIQRERSDGTLEKITTW